MSVVLFILTGSMTDWHLCCCCFFFCCQAINVQIATRSTGQLYSMHWAPLIYTLIHCYAVFVVVSLFATSRDESSITFFHPLLLLFRMMCWQLKLLLFFVLFVQWEEGMFVEYKEDSAESNKTSTFRNIWMWNSGARSPQLSFSWVQNSFVHESDGWDQSSQLVFSSHLACSSTAWKTPVTGSCI